MNQRVVTLTVNTREIFEQAVALPNHKNQTPSGAVILFVGAEMVLKGVNMATCTSGLPESLACRRLSVMTFFFAAIEIILFPNTCLKTDVFEVLLRICSRAL